MVYRLLACACALRQRCHGAGEGPEGDVQGEEDQGVLSNEKKPARKEAEAYTG